MSKRLLDLNGRGGGFSPFVDVALNGMITMLVVLGVYMALTNIPKPPRIRTDSLPEAIWFQGYQTAISVSDGSGRLRFVFDSPVDLAAHNIFPDSTGMFQGNPSPVKSGQEKRTFNIPITVTVIDSQSRRDSASFNLVVNPVSIPFDPESDGLRVPGKIILPDAWVGNEYHFTPPILGGIEPYEWTLGALPAGLVSQENTITGIPLFQAVPDGEEFADYEIPMEVVDQQSSLVPPGIPRNPSLHTTIQIRVRQPQAISTRTILPRGREGLAYRAGIMAVGGSGKLVFESMDGNLAALGLRLDPDFGEIRGTLIDGLTDGRPVNFLARIRIYDSENRVSPLEEVLTIRVVPPMGFVSPE